MNIRNAQAAAATAALSAAMMLVAGPAVAAAPTNGCPSGYDLVSVASLAALGYQVPGIVDDPESGVLSFGQAGNGDGWVCARTLGNLTGSLGQIYNFMDNQLPSSGS